MSNAKMIQVKAGGDLSDMFKLCILRAKRDEEGMSGACLHVAARRPESGETALFLVDKIDAKQGAGNGTTFTFTRIAGSGFPSRMSLTNRAPSPCDLEMLADASVLAFYRALESDTVVIPLNEPAPSVKASKPRATPAVAGAAAIPHAVLDEVARLAVERARAELGLGPVAAVAAVAAVAMQPTVEASAEASASSDDASAEASEEASAEASEETSEGDSLVIDSE